MNTFRILKFDGTTGLSWFGVSLRFARYAISLAFSLVVFLVLFCLPSISQMGERKKQFCVAGGCFGVRSNIFLLVFLPGFSTFYFHSSRRTRWRSFNDLKSNKFRVCVVKIEWAQATRIKVQSWMMKFNENEPFSALVYDFILFPTLILFCSRFCLCLLMASDDFFCVGSRTGENGGHSSRHLRITAISENI